MRKWWRRTRRKGERTNPVSWLLFILVIVFVTSVAFFVHSWNVLKQARYARDDDFSRCKPCKNLHRSHGNSSPDDLIICGVFGNELRAAPFLQTLRAVGCKASVVFVTNRTVPRHIVDQFRDCGARFFEMKTSSATDHFYPHSLRYIGYKEFLDAASRKYNRVFHADAYDVFFQRDPFNEEIRSDRLYFTLEDVLIQNSTWNSGWLVRAYNESVSKELGNFTVSCSGTVIGGYEQFMRYLVTMLNHMPFWKNGRHSLDQAYHNYLLHTGAFERAGVHPEFLGCNSQILTMHYCSRNRIHTSDGVVVGPDGKTVPAVVHQYNLFRGAGKVLGHLCAK